MSEEPVTTDTSEEAPKEPGWLESIPEEYRDKPAFTKYKSLDEFAKGYDNVNKMVGNSVRIPTEDSNDEEINEFYSKLGRPESGDKYSYERPEMPEGVPYSEDAEKAFFQLAHSKGLTQDQASSILDYYNQFTVNSTIDQKREADELYAKGEADLKKVWGIKGYENNVAIAQRAVREYGDEELDKLLTETNLGNNPAVIKAFYKIGSKLQEAKPLDSDYNSSFLDKSQATSEIDGMIKNKNHKFHDAYWDTKHPEHKEALAYRDRLYNMAYAEE